MLELEVTPRALAQLERAAKWWAANRQAAPGAVAHDFAAAARLLALQPGIGPAAPLHGTQSFEACNSIESATTFTLETAVDRFVPLASPHEQ